MKKKKGHLSKTLPFIMAICFIALNLPIAHAQDTTTRIYLEPSENIYHVPPTTVGTLFNITCWVEDVIDLAAWQVGIIFNDTIINFTRWFEPTWDSQYVFYGNVTMATPSDEPYPGGGYYLTNFWHIPQWNPNWPGYGQIKVGTARFPPPSPGQGFSGTGKLFIIECNITAVPPEGVTYSDVLRINHTDTYLLNSEGNEMENVVIEDGYYSIPEFQVILLLPILTGLASLAFFVKKKLGKLQPIRC
ncbi:MAG: hypothetical protein QXQ94_08715 [Candidatus Bathyarchaeia archaeon]